MISLVLWGVEQSVCQIAEKKKAASKKFSLRRLINRGTTQIAYRKTDMPPLRAPTSPMLLRSNTGGAYCHKNGFEPPAQKP